LKGKNKLLLSVFLFLMISIFTASLVSASNQFFYNESEAETSTTSATFVDKTTLTLITEAAPYLIFASGEIRGGVNSADVLARLLIDGTTDYGNISFQPDTTGDRETFAFMRVVNLTVGTHSAALQYAAESGQTTYLRRARIFATELDSYFYAENESEITPSTTPTDITTLTFSPAEAGNYLILGTAEISAGSTANSIEVNLSIDGSVVNAVSNVGETTTDFESFAGQNTTYLTASSHTIKITARATTGTTQKIRRARIVAIRIPENFRDFFNESSAQSSTQSNAWQQKLSLVFTPNVTGIYFITGTADIWSSSATNGAYVDVNLTIDGVEYGFTTVGLSATSDRITFVTSKSINLTNTSHTIVMYFRQTESIPGIPTVYIRNARINALGPDDRPSVSIPLVFNSTLSQPANFSLGELIRIRVNVSDAAGSSDISQVLINITKPNGTLNVTNALMTSIASITDGFTYEYNFTIPNENASIGTWNISIIANDTINAKGSNRTNFSASDASAPNISSTTATPSPVNMGSNITINATVSDNVAVDKVWVTVWNATTAIITKFLSFVSGNLYSTQITTNESFATNATYTIYANDTSKNNATPLNGSFLVNRAPKITLNSPANNTQFNNTQNINFNFTAVDDINTTLSCSIYLDSALNQTNASTQNNTATIFTINDISYGNHSWFVNCTDGSLSNVSETRAFSINDTLAPSIQFVAPTPANASILSQNFIPANITFSDLNIDTATISLYNSTSLVNSTSGSISPLFVNFTGLPDGVYYLNATANDTAGNRNNTETRTITLDTIAPTISIISPQNTTYNNATILVNISSNGDNVWFTNASGQNESYTTPVYKVWNEGSNTMYAYANDTAGNLNSTSVTFTVDTTPPAISNVNATSITNQSATITWDTDELSNSTVNYGTTTALGSYATNSTLVTSHSIPLTSLTNFTLYYYNVTSCDSSGNCNTSGPFNFTTLQNNDTIPPSITFTAPTPANNATINVSSAFINTTITDNVNVSSALLEWNGTNESMNFGGGDNWYKNKTGLADGTYTYKVWANDTTNNFNVSETRTLIVNTTVNQPPSITLNYPPNNTQINNTQDINFNFTAIDDLNTTLSCSIYLDSVLNQTNSSTSNNTATIFAIIGIPYSNHSWYVNCSDGSLSNVSETRYFSINDTIPPSITIVSPIATTYNYSNILVNISTTDNVAVDKMWFNWNGTNESYTAPVYVNFTPDGSYTLYAYATDTFNNINSTNVTFTVNTSIDNPPSLTLLSPNNNAIDGDGNVYFNCSATDDISLQNISLYFNGNLNQSQNISGTSNQTSFTLSGIANGNYNWSCLAYDSGGNFNQSETRNLTVDSSAVPTYNSSYFAGETTNWSNVDDLTNVCNGTAILDVPNVGAVQWNGCVNASYQNFDANVIITYNNVTVLFGLNPTFNSSAIIAIRNLSWEDVPDIYKDGVICPETECTDINYNNGTVMFNVIGFTSYTTAGNAQLEIWDETDSGMPYSGFIRYVNDSVKFFANYTKVSNGNPITGATCSINFTDLNAAMSYNATTTLYEYNRSFSVNGTFPYNVTCDRTGFELLTTNDSVFISPDNVSPSLAVQSPVNNSVYATNNISLNYTVSDNIAVDKCWFIDVNGTIINLTNCQNTTFIANEGSNNITVYVNDTNNNINSTQIFFTVDTQNPVINFISPTPENNASINTNYVLINVSVENGISPIESCSLNFNGTIYNMTKVGTGNSVTCNYNVSGLSEGIYQYNVTANDSIGNTGNSTTRIINIDFTPPGTITGLNETATGTNYILWNWTNPTDDDFNHTEVWINGTFKANVTTNYYNATGLSANTTYEIEIRTVDNAGNINGSWVNDSATTNIIITPVSKVSRISGGIANLGNQTEVLIIDTCLAKEQPLYFYAKNKKLKAEVIELTDESVNLMINNIQYGFKGGDVKEIDTDNNGIDDLRINLTMLRVAKACFAFYEIKEKEKKIEVAVEKEPEFVNITEEKPVEIKKSYLWIWLVVAFALAGIAAMSYGYASYVGAISTKRGIISIRKNRLYRIKEFLYNSLRAIIFVPVSFFKILFRLKPKKRQIITDSMIFERKRIQKAKSPKIREGGFRRIRMSRFFEWLFSFGGAAVNVNGNIVVIKRNRYKMWIAMKFRRFANRIKNFFSTQEKEPAISMEIERFVPAKKTTPGEFERKVVERRVWRYDKFVKDTKQKMLKKDMEKKKTKGISMKKQIIEQLKEVYRI